MGLCAKKGGEINWGSVKEHIESLLKEEKVEKKKKEFTTWKDREENDQG